MTRELLTDDEIEVEWIKAALSPDKDEHYKPVRGFADAISKIIQQKLINRPPITNQEIDDYITKAIAVCVAEGGEVLQTYTRLIEKHFQGVSTNE